MKCFPVRAEQVPGGTSLSPGICVPKSAKPPSHHTRSDLVMAVLNSPLRLERYSVRKSQATRFQLDTHQYLHMSMECVCVCVCIRVCMRGSCAPNRLQGDKVPLALVPQSHFLIFSILSQLLGLLISHYMLCLCVPAANVHLRICL